MSDPNDHRSPSQTDSVPLAPWTDRLFHELAGIISEVVFTARPDGSCDYLNPSFYQITGLPPGSGLGDAWTQAIHPDDQLRILSEWRESVASGTRFGSDFRLRTAQRTYRR